MQDPRSAMQGMQPHPMLGGGPRSRHLNDVRTISDHHCLLTITWPGYGMTTLLQRTGSTQINLSVIDLTDRNGLVRCDSGIEGSRSCIICKNWTV